jgi:hypothetical protein
VRRGAAQAKVALDKLRATAGEAEYLVNFVPNLDEGALEELARTVGDMARRLENLAEGCCD